MIIGILTLIITYIYPIGESVPLETDGDSPTFYKFGDTMILKSIECDIEIVFSELREYVNKLQFILDKTKTIIGNDLAACNRDNCTIEKPCVVCRSLKQLDKEIDSLLE